MSDRDDRPTPHFSAASCTPGRRTESRPPPQEICTQHFVKMRFQRYAGGQTYRRTDRRVDHNTPTGAE